MNKFQKKNRFRLNPSMENAIILKVVITSLTVSGGNSSWETLAEACCPVQNIQRVEFE
jgi:hypothetical protein